MKLLRFLAYFTVGAFLHSWVTTHLSPGAGGAAPNLPLLVTIVAAIAEGRGFGQFLGFSLGFYCDLLGVRLFGAHCLLLTIVGYWMGGIRRHMDVYNLMSQAALAGIATAAYPFCWGLLALMFHNSMMLPAWKHILLQPLFNAALAPVFFALLSRRLRNPVNG